MPCVVKCSECGYVLTKWEEMQQASFGDHAETWYERLYRRFRGRCPRCKHKLPKPEGYAKKMKVEVIANEVT